MIPVRFSKRCWRLSYAAYRRSVSTPSAIWQTMEVQDGGRQKESQYIRRCGMATSNTMLDSVFLRKEVARAHAPGNSGLVRFSGLNADICWHRKVDDKPEAIFISHCSSLLSCFRSRSVQYYDHRHVCQHRERMTNWRSITSMCSSVKNTSRSAVAACMQLLSSKLLWQSCLVSNGRI